MSTRFFFYRKFFRAFETTNLAGLVLPRFSFPSLLLPIQDVIRYTSYLPLDHSRMEKKTPITIPPEIISLLEATALANDCKSEEIILASIKAFLDGDRKYQVGE